MAVLEGLIRFLNAQTEQLQQRARQCEECFHTKLYGSQIKPHHTQFRT